MEIALTAVEIRLQGARPEGNWLGPLQQSRERQERLGPGGSGRDGNKCSDFGYILKAEPEGYLRSFNTTVYPFFELMILALSGISN